MKYRGVAATMMVAIVAGLIGYLYIERNRTVRAERQQTLALAVQHEELKRSNARLARSQSHYMHLYNMYAATERHRQYGIAADNVAIFYGKARDFARIEDVTEKIVCPKPVKKIPSGFTFYGVRNIVLNRTGKPALFYSASYQGNFAFVRDRDEFDSLIDLGNPGKGGIVQLKQSQAANLMAGAPKPLTRNGSFITPFSFNTADVNGDGTDDFFYGGRLYLSDKGGYHPISDDTLDGNEVIFVRDGFLTPHGNIVERWRYEEDHLVKAGEVTLEASAAKNRPFTIFPLAGALTDLADVIVITASTYDFYALRDGRTQRVLSVPATAPHSVIIGARGDFDGDGKDDIWLTESRWRNQDGKIVGRASLLSSRKFNTGASRLRDIVSFTLYGSGLYTDSDGIGASLSPVAGDFDRDGKPDLSISGHIHMNEAGALYILRGKDISGVSQLSISDAPVIRIVGRPVSNLAPPFVHYDMPSQYGSRIVVAADNDLCSGVAGGAIYFLDVGKLVQGHGS
ncbi:MAG TPA: hypothetical protein VJL90_15785 [Pseudorhodoplanes sp.]|nr:hypothetical protein [Pseudorhodoplanes sp.]